MYRINAAGLLCPDIFINSSAGNPDRYIFVQKDRRQVCEEISLYIIEQHKGSTVDNYLLPIYNHQNRNHISHLRTYNKRLKRLSEMLKLEIPLSSYVSRHSWATIALRKGISVQIISEGMGHENEKTTRIYLASMDQSIVDDANAQIIALQPMSSL